MIKKSSFGKYQLLFFFQIYQTILKSCLIFIEFYHLETKALIKVFIVKVHLFDW
jgi:hypothetical protein